MKRIVFLLVFLFMGINIYSQEIGIAPTKIWTDNYEIENPAGYGIYFLQPFGRFEIKLEFVSAQNERRYYGFLHGGFLAGPEDFTRGSIFSSSSFRAIELSFQIPRVYEVFQNYFNIGAGITFDKFTRDKVGLSSGKKYSSGEDKFGFFYSVSLSRRNIFGLPIKFEIIFKQKLLLKGNYALDSDQPFTNAIDVKELQFGLAYLF